MQLPLLLIGAATKRAFTNYVTVEVLVIAATLFAVITLGLVAATYYTLNRKRKKYFSDKNIKESIEQWVTDVILGSSGEQVVMPAGLAQLINMPDVRQLLIDELIKEKSIFLGAEADSIVKIYNDLGLSTDSKRKLEDNRNHIVCQGVHELCMMDQKDMLTKVYRFTNSPDKDVRIEAQTALVQWFGFKGLRFLDVVSYPITQFQQLKLLELLRQANFSGMPKLSKWIQSSNDTVADFALKLTEHYKQVKVYNEVAHCLSHNNETVRIQAVKALASIGNNEAAELLIKVYPKEGFTNKLNILKEIRKTAGEGQRDFLITQLHQGHELLKLEAAIALASCTEDGMEVLEALAYEKPDPYKNIYSHIKSEVPAYVAEHHI